jgi:hypothetical protein
MKTGLLVAAGLSAMVLGAGVIAQTASAHHAFQAEFDGDSPVLLKGKVTTVEWVNPHTWVHLSADDGKQWMVEGGTPNTLLRMGLDRNMLKVGTEIIVRGYQAKDKRCLVVPATRKETCKANGRDITFTNGCKVFMGSSGTGAPQDGADGSELKAGQKQTTQAKCDLPG